MLWSVLANERRLLQFVSLQTFVCFPKYCNSSSARCPQDQLCVRTPYAKVYECFHRTFVVLILPRYHLRTPVLCSKYQHNHKSYRLLFGWIVNSARESHRTAQQPAEGQYSVSPVCVWDTYIMWFGSHARLSIKIGHARLESRQSILFFLEICDSFYHRRRTKFVKRCNPEGCTVTSLPKYVALKSLSPGISSCSTKVYHSPDMRVISRSTAF